MYILRTFKPEDSSAGGTLIKIPKRRRVVTVGRHTFAFLCLIVCAGVPPLFACGDLSLGDGAFRRMEYDLAASIYDSVLQREPGRADVLWRMARLAVCVGDISPEDRKQEWYTRAEEYALRSIALDSALSEGHTWRAAALGNLAVNGSAKKKAQIAREIKQELERAIACNPNDDVAHSILGSFYRAIGNVSWPERQLAAIFLGGLPPGGYEEGEREFRTAIEIAPDVPRHYFELGLLYVDWDRSGDALRAFSRTAELAPLMASDRSRVERARAWVTKLQKGN